MTTIQPHDVAWTYETPRMQALGFDFSVRTTDQALGAHLSTLLAPFRSTGEPASTYLIADLGPDVENRHRVWLDDEELLATRMPDVALSVLFWSINQETVARTPERILVHASCAEMDGKALLFPASMGSGKTTLVAGLVQAGFRYVTDEATAIDPSTLRIDPYPKPLSVDPGSWEVLADLRPVADPALEPLLAGPWQVAPTSIWPGALAPRCEPRLIIAPRYEAGARTALMPMRRAEALVDLAENTFRFAERGRVAFDTLARVVERCDCYRLTVGDLDDAVTLIRGLVPNGREATGTGGME